MAEEPRFGKGPPYHLGMSLNAGRTILPAAGAITIKVHPLGRNLKFRLFLQDVLKLGHQFLTHVGIHDGAAFHADQVGMG